MIRLDAEIRELKTKSKSKDITEKTSDEPKSTDVVSSSEEVNKKIL